MTAFITSSDRRVAEPAVPDDAPAHLGDHAPHLVGVEIDPGQHLHRVRRAGGRGDRARGGLGDGEPVRDHDGDHDHGDPGPPGCRPSSACRPPSRPARRFSPSARPARWRRRSPRRRRGSARRRPGTRPSRARHSARPPCPSTTASTSASPRRRPAIRARSAARLAGSGARANGDRRALLEAEKREGMRRQRQRVRGDQRRVVDQVQRACDGAPAARHLDLARAEEALGGVCRAAPVEIGDRLAPGVDGEPDEPKHRSARRGGGRCRPPAFRR